MPNSTEPKGHPWQDTIRHLKEEHYEEASTPRRALPPRSSSPRRVPGQSARPLPIQVDYTNYNISSSRRRPRVGIFRAASPYDGSSAMESNMDSLELALQDTSKTSSSTMSTTSRSPYRNNNGHDTSQDTCSTETELEQLQPPLPLRQEASPPTKPPQTWSSPRRSYPTAYSPNPTNPFANSPAMTHTTNQYAYANNNANSDPHRSAHSGHNSSTTNEHGHGNPHSSTRDTPTSSFDPFISDTPTEYGTGGGHTVTSIHTSSQETSAASSSGEEDPRFREKMGLHILCAEATSQHDIAWRNALYLLGMQPPLAQVVDGDGRTALHVACDGDHAMQDDSNNNTAHPTAPPCYMIRALLVANVAAARQPDRDGRLPIHCLAASSGDVDGLQILVETYPASITVRDAGGWTPLQLFLQNPMVLVTLAQMQILLGMTLPLPQEEQQSNTARHRIRLRRGDHLKLKVEHLDQMLQETNPVYDPLSRYKIPEEVLNSYQDDIRICLKRLVQWDKKQQRQKKQQQQQENQNASRQANSQEEKKDSSFAFSANTGLRSLEDESGETNPAAMASPTGRQLPLHMLVYRGLLDSNLQRSHSDPSSSPKRNNRRINATESPRQAHQQSLIILVRLLIAAFPEALITRDSAGHTPLLLAMLTANTEILPSQELLALLLGKRTAGFESLPPWAEDVPYPSQNAYAPPNRNRLSAAAERYINPAMVATLDTGQLPLHIAAEEWGDHSSLMIAVYESYPGAIHVQDARGRMPLHILLQNYRRITPHPQVVALLLSDRVAQTTSDEGQLPFDLLVQSASCLPLEPSCERISPQGYIAHPDPFKAFRQFFQSSIIATAAKSRENRACRSIDGFSTDPSFRRRRSESQLFLCRLRTLPPWLRRQACSVPFVQELLLEELASPGKCAYILMYGIFLALLLFTFRRQMDTYMDNAPTVTTVPDASDNATFFNGSGEGILNSFVNTTPERYDPWNTLGVYGLSAGIICFQATFWACSWFLNEFQHLCLFNIWRWIDSLAVVLVVLTTAMIHESFSEENILTLGTAATGMLWFSIVGYLSSWWYGMAFFTGAIMKIARMLLWPTSVAAIFLVGFAEMFYTLGHRDCTTTRDDLSICSLREAYQLIYFLVLGEPIFDAAGMEPIRPGMALLVAVFTTLGFLVLLSFLVVVVVVASKCDAETLALDAYWEPKLAFVLSSQDSRTLAGHQKKAKASHPSSLDRLVSKLEELWDIAISLVSGRGRERYWYARGSSLLENCVLKLIAAVLIPLWVVAGVFTLGVLWPPQLRRFVFEPRVWVHGGDEVKPNEAREFFTAQVSDFRNEVMKLKDMSYDQSNDVHNEIQELKALLIASMKDK